MVYLKERSVVTRLKNTLFAVLSLSFAILLVIGTPNTNVAEEAYQNPYLVRTFFDEEGRQIDEIIVPERPPEVKATAASVPEPNIAMGINVLSSVPAFDWSYGCSATAAAMMFGYYDNGDYTNMYAGPTNGGVCPMDNSVWDSGECPLSATHQGYDGLTGKGHVDDYWDSYGSDVDPYYGNWAEHTYADCTADYMGTNQYYNWHNTDGATTFYFYTNGDPLYDYSGAEPFGYRDGCHGMRLFAESRGYNVFHDGTNYQNYNQYIYGYQGNTLGFTFDQFKAEIDAGRPVIIQVKGHSMLGYGYNTTGSIVYIHDTWDYNDHQMTWGGTYSGLQHYGVTVTQLFSPLVSVSASTIAPHATEPGQKNVGMMKLTLVVDGGTATWTAIKVDNRAFGGGTVDAADIDSVKIYKEVTGEGFSSTQDSLIGGSTITGTSGGAGTVILTSAQTIATTSANYYIVYDIASGADPSRYAGVELYDSTYVTVAGPAQVANTNFPIQSSYDTSLPIELASFTATPGDGEITLQWVTQSETDNSHFNIYRSTSQDSGYVKLPVKIEGQESSPTAHVYTWTDTRLTNGITYYYKIEDVDLQGRGTMHGPVVATPGKIRQEIPDQYALLQNYPNPFNLTTEIKYQLPEDSQVTLKVYDILGQLVNTLVDKAQPAGFHSIRWDGKDKDQREVSSGVYLYQLKTEEFEEERRMLLLR